MDPRSPRILVIYPYLSIDTNPFMAFLLESLAARRVAVDVLLEQSPQFLAPDPFGTSVHLKGVGFLPPQEVDNPFGVRHRSPRYHGEPLHAHRSYLQPMLVSCLRLGALQIASGQPPC